MVGIGAFGWYALRQITLSVRAVSEQGLTPVRLLGTLRSARLEAIIAVQEGAAWNIDSFQASMSDRKELLAEGQGTFQSIGDRFDEANRRGLEAYAAYDAAPKSEAQARLWSEMKPMWQDFVHFDQRQLELTRELVHAADWGEFRLRFPEYQGSALRWATAYANLDVPLARIVADSSAEAAQARMRADQVVSTASRVMLGAVVGANLLVIVIGITIARGVLGSLEAMRLAIGRIVESGDFRLRADVKGQDELAQTAGAVNRLVTSMQESLHAVVDATRTVGSCASEASQVSARVADSAGQQSDAANAMTLAVQQVVERIGHITELARDAHERSEQSGAAARIGVDTLGRASEEMGAIAREVIAAGDAVARLERDSREISGIVKVIQDVAAQTNLLALNAAIEAARAGEQGRGFAVVADEVRKLAERTSRSAQEIADKIHAVGESIQGAVRNVESVVARAGAGHQLSQNAAEEIRRICEAAAGAAALIEQVSAAMSDQDAAARQISQRVSVVAHLSAETHASGTASATVSRSLDGAAGALGQAVARFKV